MTNKENYVAYGTFPGLVSPLQFWWNNKYMQKTIIFSDEEINELGFSPEKPLFLTVMAERVKEKAGLKKIPRLLKFERDPLFFQYKFTVKSND